MMGAVDKPVWRWTGFDDRPDWVLATTELNADNEIVLLRRSGKQIVYRGERLTIDTDGEVLALGVGA